MHACKALEDDSSHSHLGGVEADFGAPATTDPDLLNWKVVGEVSESGLVDLGGRAGYHTCLHDKLEPKYADYQFLAVR